MISGEDEDMQLPSIPVLLAFGRGARTIFCFILTHMMNQ